MEARLRLEHAQRLAGQRAHVDRLLHAAFPPHQTADAAQDLAGAQSFGSDLLEGVEQRGRARTDPGAQALHAALRVVGDRTQRLVDLVRQRRRHLTDGVQAQHVRELVLMPAQFLLQLVQPVMSVAMLPTP